MYKASLKLCGVDVRRMSRAKLSGRNLPNAPSFSRPLRTRHSFLSHDSTSCAVAYRITAERTVQDKEGDTDRLFQLES